MICDFDVTICDILSVCIYEQYKVGRCVKSLSLLGWSQVLPDGQARGVRC